MSTVAPEVQEAHDLLQGRLSTIDKERSSILDSIAALPMNGSAPAAKPRRSTGRPRKAGAVSASATPKRRRQRKGVPTRAEQALRLVEKDPGISATDVAKAMKIKPNYLYRVLGDLEQEKRVTKKGRSYFPAS